jgi:methylenetetrahydrofolate--tRNA-(uracil-5-)-methyltransferase
MQSSYNLVGFQNHLKFDEQKRIFRMIPGLERAEFLRLGQIHRNTYIQAPDTLLPTMAARKDERVFFAGQLAGTEGYIENIASGLVAGINAAQILLGGAPIVFAPETPLAHFAGTCRRRKKHFAPMNINFGLLPPIEAPRRISKEDKQRLLCERALQLCRPASTSMA